MNHSNHNSLPIQPFFSTPEQRLALARQRYFEEGVRPSGLVSESVIQSWSRCLQAQRRPGDAVTFPMVTASRTHSALTRSRVLLEAASNELRQLASTLAGTSCTLFLTDPQGVVVHHAFADYNADEVLLPLARRVGCNLSEETIGTNAPGLTAHTGEPYVVLGAEHFFGGVQVMHCAAAPIRDIHGRLDLTRLRWSASTPQRLKTICCVRSRPTTSSFSCKPGPRFWARRWKAWQALRPTVALRG